MLRWAAPFLFVASVSAAAIEVPAQFKTVKAAIDSVPEGNTAPVTIHIAPGRYLERLEIPASKPFLTLRGDDAKTTILTFNNSALTAGGTGKSGSIYFLASDTRAENLTFENSYGVGSQAVAVYTNADRLMFLRCRFLGWQDTLYANGNGNRQLFRDCYIEGHVDFIFGNALAVFENCEIRAKGKGYLTAQSKLDASQNSAYVFRNCRLTADPGVDKVFLGRPWRPYSTVVFLNCEMGAHILPEGWNNWQKPDAEKTSFYGEYGSKGPGGGMSARVSWAHALTKEEVGKFDTAKLFGDWVP